MRKRVYIADEAMITSLGAGVETNVRAIEGYESGVSRSHDLVGRIPDMLYDGLGERYGYDLTKAEVIAVACLDKIVTENDVDPERTCFVLSTAKGNIDLLSEEVPQQDSPVFLSVMASRIASRYVLEGNVHIVSNACISGLSAQIVAKRFLEDGKYDAAIVCGVDVQSRFIISGFASFKSLSHSVCRPYDKSRDGLNLGEACGVLYLKAIEADAPLPSGTVLLEGGAVSCDANHLTGPSRTGDGLFFAIRNAMNEAEIEAGDVSFIQMHGTATVYNDEMESKAANLAGLGHTPCQSLKPYFGHTMGASGVIETIMCAEQLKKGLFFGTKGFSTLGVPMPLDVCATHRKLRMKRCVKTASGFAGSNAAIVLSLSAHSRAHEDFSERSFRLIRKVTIEKSTLTVEENEETVLREIPDCEDFPAFIRRLYNDSGCDYPKFFKMDDMSKLGFMAAESLLDGIEFSEEEAAVILENRRASLNDDLKHQHIIDTEGDANASPAVFVYTLPNVASGEISIRHHIKGENTFFISDSYNRQRMISYARALFARTGVKYCVIGWLDLLKENYCAIFELLNLTKD